MDMNLGKLWEMVWDREAWRATVHEVAKSWTWLSEWSDLIWSYVHSIGDAIQPSHPVMPSSPSSLNLSQHQGLFQWDGSHQMTKILEFQLQHQSFQWVFRVDFPQYWLVCSPCCPSESQESFRTKVQRHRFFGTLPSLWFSSHKWTWPLGTP